MLESQAFRVWFAATLLTCALSCGRALSAQEKQHSIAPESQYRIHIGDVIKVDVWKEPEIARTVPVDRKGNIHLPGIHDVKAAGLTVMELAGLIRHKLEGILTNPQVTVTITEISNPSALPPQLLQAPGVRPLIPPSHQLRDVPSPELLQHCCVARETSRPTSSATA
jgi:hypothetical protein